LVLVSLEKGKSGYHEEDTKNGLLCSTLRTLYTKDGSKRKKLSKSNIRRNIQDSKGRAGRNDVKWEWSLSREVSILALFARTRLYWSLLR